MISMTTILSPPVSHYNYGQKLPTPHLQVITRSIIMRITIWVVAVFLALATVQAAKKPKGKGKGKVGYRNYPSVKIS
jgi:hypothetical protein